jgi:hypothetical protein
VDRETPLAFVYLFLKMVKGALIVTENIFTSDELEVHRSEGPHISLVAVFLSKKSFRSH